MSRPKKRKGGRVTPKGTGAHEVAARRSGHGLSKPLGGPPLGGAAGPLPMSSAGAFDDGLDEPDVLALAGEAIAGGHPADLLVLASTFAEVAGDVPSEHRGRPGNPAPDEPDGEPPTWSEVVGELLSTVGPETTALLYALRPFASELWRKKITVELARRSTPTLPAWICSIDRPEVTDVWFRSHVLGDDDDVFMGVRWPTGQVLTFVVHIDHHSGGTVQDVLLAPTSVEAFLERFGGGDEAAATLTRVEAAAARARIEAAVRRWEMTWPGPVSDDWPSMRPMLSWLLSTMPEGVTVRRPDGLDEDGRDELVDLFMGSRHSEPVRDDEDTRTVVEHIVWFGSDYGVADPLRWSGRRIELLMLDWYPRKVVTDEDFLAKLPGVLASFVPFALERLGERDDLSEDLVSTFVEDARAAIVGATPEYLETIAGRVDPFGSDAGDPVQGLLDHLGADADEEMRAHLAELLASDDDDR